MFHYLEDMHKMITPLNYSITSILKKDNSKQSQHPKQYSILNTVSNIQLKHERKLSSVANNDIQQQLLIGKKENMFLRQENLQQLRQIDQLAQTNDQLRLQIDQYKTKAAKDREYLIKLEQILTMNKFKLDKSKRKKYFPVASSLSSSNCNQENGENIANLKTENEKMQKFKNEIYKISNEYDTINTTIFNLIKEIKNLFEELNTICLNANEKDCDGVEIGINYEKEINFFIKVKEDIEKIFDLMVKTFNSKQDEYQYLLNEKELKIIELNETKVILIKEKDNLIEDNLRKESLIDDLKNEIYLMKDRKERLNNLKNDNIEKNKKNKNKCSAHSFCECIAPQFESK